jgi:uncharacterized protein involved in outer membrane biogenesis
MRWKWLIGSFLFLIIALMAAIYVFLYTFDYNKLKPRIARMVKDATGRELNLGGEVDLAIGFSPTLVVTDVSFANASWGSQPQMIKVEKIQAQVLLLPLLFRDLQLKRIGLTGVDVLLETDPNGYGNWDFITGDSSAGKAGAFKPKDIDIDNFRIEKFQLIFREGKTESTKRFTLASLDVARGDSEDELTLELKANYNGQPLTLSGKTGLIRELLGSERFALELSGAFSDAAIKLEGAVDNVLKLKGIDLKVQTSGKNLAKLKLTKNIQLPKTSAFDLTGHLWGSKESLGLNDLSGNLSGSDVSLVFSGSVGDLIKINGIDLQLKGSGKDLAELGAIIDQKLPATDEFAIQGRLTGSAKALSLQGAQGSARRGSLSVALSGEVRDLIAFNGLDLQLKGSGKNLAEVGSIIGEKLPATDEFELEGRLIGSTQALSLKDVQATARRDRLQLSLRGGVKNLLTFRGLDLQSQLIGTDLAKFGDIIGAKLPATDQFKVLGRLTGSAKALSLHAAQGNALRGNLELSLQGGIKDLIGLSGMDLKLKGSGKDLAEVGPIIGQNLPTTDNFSVQGRLKGSTKALSLEEAMGRAGRDGMSVAFDGKITDVLALKSINIRLKASGKELAAIGPLVGSNLPKIGPFDVRGHLIGSARLLLLKELSATVDKSDFNGLAKIEFGKRPKLTVQLESSVIDFTPFMRMAEKDKRELGLAEKREHRLFPQDPLPFDALKKVDADIAVKARNIHVRDAQLEFGHLALILEDSNLSIDKLEATYKQTKISGNLHLDSGSPPQVATHFLVQNFDLGNLLKEAGVSDQIRAVVDIAAHGKSSGDSVHSLMANLDGSIGAVMGPGYLTKYLDLLSAGLSQKVVQFWKPPKAVEQIKCAVVQFDVKEGVAASRAFVFNTRAGIVSGEGEINLGTEQINFLLVPNPKDLSLSLSTKLRVSGSIMDPKVSPDKLALLSRGARALSALVIGPLGLLAPFVHLGAYQKHPCEIHSISQLGLQDPTSK